MDFKRLSEQINEAKFVTIDSQDNKDYAFVYISQTLKLT